MNYLARNFRYWKSVATRAVRHPKALIITGFSKVHLSWSKVIYPLAGLNDICTYEISVLFTWNARICKVFHSMWKQKDPGELLLQGLIFCWIQDNRFYPKRDNDDCPGTFMSRCKVFDRVWCKHRDRFVGRFSGDSSAATVNKIAVLFAKNACIFKVLRYVWQQKDPGKLLLQGLIFCWGGIIIFIPNGIRMIAPEHRVKPCIYYSTLFEKAQ